LIIAHCLVAQSRQFEPPDESLKSIPTHDSAVRMSAEELRASLGLAGIFGLRMLGMFIILPVFALYAEHLPGGADHTWVGIALGAYGLTQALLQVPFGWLSDHWGRKRTIYFGLLIFALGSFIAAMATSIYGVILGRVVQGSGAVSAAVLALTADLTREEVRTKAMAIIGMTIGITFGISMIGGPPLSHWIGVPGIFALTGVLALAAILVVWRVIPNAARSAAIGPTIPLAVVLRDGQLLRLNFGIFSLHALLMAMFIVIPFDLRNLLPVQQHGYVYLPVMIGAFVLMVPPMILSEKRGLQKQVFICAIALIIAALAVLAFGNTSLTGLIVGLLIFFTAFNLLEASLPSLISKFAPEGARGKAMGVYSSLQFFGTFLGAAAGGWLSQHVGAGAVYAFCATLAVIWIVCAFSMRAPAMLRTRSFTLPLADGVSAAGLEEQLRRLPGVREALVKAGEGVAVLRVDMRGFDEQNVINLLAREV
jgi:MFS family permease